MRRAAPVRFSPSRSTPQGQRFQDLLQIAQEKGLLEARKRVIRGRMPEALVTKAKARTGVKSDTALLEVALANLALADDYPEWLLSRKGTLHRKLELEF